MQKNTFNLLVDKFGISEKVLDLVSRAEEKIEDNFARLDDIKAYNQYKVLDVFRECRISDRHFAWNTGYGYDDAGREALEEVYAGVFGTESAIVRPLIVNGTHALTLTLTGICLLYTSPFFPNSPSRLRSMITRRKTVWNLKD